MRITSYRSYCGNSPINIFLQLRNMPPNKQQYNNLEVADFLYPKMPSKISLGFLCWTMSSTGSCYINARVLRSKSWVLRCNKPHWYSSSQQTNTGQSCFTATCWMMRKLSNLRLYYWLLLMLSDSFGFWWICCILLTTHENCLVELIGLQRRVSSANCKLWAYKSFASLRSVLLPRLFSYLLFSFCCQCYFVILPELADYLWPHL